jgi:hypothetical protein
MFVACKLVSLSCLRSEIAAAGRLHPTRMPCFDLMHFDPICRFSDLHQPEWQAMKKKLNLTWLNIGVDAFTTMKSLF